MFTIPFSKWLCLVLFLIVLGLSASTFANGLNIALIPGDQRGGKAIHLIYHLDLPLEIVWRYKTDFGSFLHGTWPRLGAHRFLGYQGKSGFIEQVYQHLPGLKFIWDLRDQKAQHRIEGTLINALLVGQRFNYWSSTLTAEEEGTRIDLKAYFDWQGVSSWTNDPSEYGMRGTYQNFVDWERVSLPAILAQYRLASVPKSPIRS